MNKPEIGLVHPSSFILYARVVAKILMIACLGPGPVHGYIWASLIWKSQRYPATHARTVPTTDFKPWRLYEAAQLAADSEKQTKPFAVNCTGRAWNG